MIFFCVVTRKIFNLILQCCKKKDSNFSWLFPFQIRIRGTGFLFDCRRFHPEDLLICDQLCFQQYFELPPGSVFVDVGANIGLFSLLAAGYSKAMVYAIEPVPSNIEQLKKNIAQNGFTTIQVIPLALWNKKEDALPFFLDQNLAIGSVKKGFPQKIFVAADTLDNVVKTYGIPKITLLKLDVEGAEEEVLEGAKKTLEHDRPHVIFEALNEDSLKAITSFLMPFGYTITAIEQINFFAHSPALESFSS